MRTVNRKDLLCFCALIPFFKTNFLGRFSIINNICIIIQMVVLGYVLIYYLSNKIKPNIIATLLFAIHAYIFIITLKNHGDIKYALTYLLNLGVIGLFIDVNKHRIKRIIKILMIHFEIVIYLNLLSMILFPNGLLTIKLSGYTASPFWYIGVSNSFTFWLYPGLIIALIFKKIYKKEKIRSYILIAVILVTIYTSMSDTGKVGITVLLVLLYFPILKKIFTPVLGGIVAIVFNILIILVNNVQFLKPILVDIMGKDMTFSSRILIWSNAILAILLNPIWGYGVTKFNNTINLLGNMGSGVIAKTATHCHSQFLQIGFKGGLLILFIYIFACFIGLYKSNKSKNSYISNLLGYSMVSFFIMSITEVFEYSLFYLLISLTYYCNTFANIEFESNKEI